MAAVYDPLSLSSRNTGIGGWDFAGLDIQNNSSSNQGRIGELRANDISRAHQSMLRSGKGRQSTNGVNRGEKRSLLDDIEHDTSRTTKRAKEEDEETIEVAMRPPLSTQNSMRNRASSSRLWTRTNSPGAASTRSFDLGGSVFSDHQTPTTHVSFNSHHSARWHQIGMNQPISSAHRRRDLGGSILSFPPEARKHMSRTKPLSHVQKVDRYKSSRRTSPTMHTFQARAKTGIPFIECDSSEEETTLQLVGTPFLRARKQVRSEALAHFKEVSTQASRLLRQEVLKKKVMANLFFLDQTNNIHLPQQAVEDHNARYDKMERQTHVTQITLDKCSPFLGSLTSRQQLSSSSQPPSRRTKPSLLGAWPRRSRSQGTVRQTSGSSSIESGKQKLQSERQYSDHHSAELGISTLSGTAFRERHSRAGSIESDEDAGLAAEEIFERRKERAQKRLAAQRADLERRRQDLKVLAQAKPRTDVEVEEKEEEEKERKRAAEATKLEVGRKRKEAEDRQEAERRRKEQQGRLAEAAKFERDKKKKEATREMQMQMQETQKEAAAEKARRDSSLATILQSVRLPQLGGNAQKLDVKIGSHDDGNVRLSDPLISSSRHDKSTYSENSSTSQSINSVVACEKNQAPSQTEKEKQQRIKAMKDRNIRLREVGRAEDAVKRRGEDELVSENGDEYATDVSYCRGRFVRVGSSVRPSHGINDSTRLDDPPVPQPLRDVPVSLNSRAGRSRIAEAFLSKSQVSEAAPTDRAADDGDNYEDEEREYGPTSPLLRPVGGSSVLHDSHKGQFLKQKAERDEHFSPLMPGGHPSQSGRERDELGTKRDRGRYRRCLGEITNADLQLFAWRNAGMTFAAIVLQYEETFGKSYARRTLQDRFRQLRDTFQEANVPRDLLKRAREGDEDSRRTINRLIGGRDPPSSSNGGGARGSGHNSDRSTDIIAPSYLSSVHRRSVGQSGTVEQQSASCPQDVSRIATVLAVPEARSVADADERPQVGGKTIDSNFNRYHFNVMAKLHEELSDENEDDREETPSEDEDPDFRMYQVERREQSGEGHENDIDLDDNEFVVCSRGFEELTEANREATRQIFLVPKGHNPVAVGKWSLLSDEVDGHLVYTLKGDGFVQVRVTHYRCRRQDGVLPRSQRVWPSRTVFSVKQRVTCYDEDDHFAERTPNIVEKFVDAGVYTDAEQANHDAIRHFVQETVFPDTPNLNRRDVMWQEARRELELELERANYASDEEILFDKEAEDEQGTKFRIWVELARLIGPRNLF